MKSDPEIGFWRTDYHTINGFRQFCRDWQPREESCLPVLALHGSLTQSDSCAEFASDALALAQNLLPERYVVMAHSFACSIALAAAHRAAGHIAAVVLVDPVMRVGMSAAPAAPSPPPPRDIRHARRRRAPLPEHGGRRVDRRRATTFRPRHHDARR